MDVFMIWVHDQTYFLIETTLHMFGNRGCLFRPLFLVAPGVGETVVFSGHSSIVESSSSHAMILLQQQLMKFKQHGHVSRPRG